MKPEPFHYCSCTCPSMRWYNSRDSVSFKSMPISCEVLTAVGDLRSALLTDQITPFKIAGEISTFVNVISSYLYDDYFAQ